MTKSSSAKSPQNIAAADAQTAWLDAWRRSMAMSEEMQRFAMARAQHNMKTFSRLAECRTPQDVMEVCTEAVREAVDDYSDEVGRMRDVAVEPEAET